MKIFYFFVFSFFFTANLLAEICQSDQPFMDGTVKEIVWYCPDGFSCSQRIGECSDISGKNCLVDYQMSGSEEAVFNVPAAENSIPFCVEPSKPQDGQGGFISEGAAGSSTISDADNNLHLGPFFIARKNEAGFVHTKNIYNTVVYPLHNFCFAEIGLAPAPTNTSEEYPACPTGNITRTDISGTLLKVNNLHACKGTDNRIYSIYTCPSQYPGCSSYYGVCYRLDGYDFNNNLIIRSCQFDFITTHHWYVPEAVCEYQFTNVASDFIKIMEPVTPTECEYRDENGICIKPPLPTDDGTDTDTDTDENSDRGKCGLIEGAGNFEIEILFFVLINLMFLWARRFRVI